ncbi:MAG: response regulator transcription factor [Candidatus Korobacteraceae bacterium]
MSSVPSSRGETVFVVGNEPGARTALQRQIESLGFKTQAFPSLKLFLEQVDPALPGCLIVDVAAHAQNGLSAQASGQGMCDRPAIYMADVADVRLAVEAMRAGAVDFLIRPVDAGELLKAVHIALEKDRQMRFARMQLNAVVAEFRSFQQHVASLTPREHEVLRHLLAGERNKEIAFQLGITEKTIKVHRARVMEKMGAQSLACLVRTASERGIGLGLHAANSTGFSRDLR